MLSLKSLYSSSMSNDGMSVAKDQSEATGAQVGSCRSGPCKSRWGLSLFHNVVWVGVWNNLNIPLLIHQYSTLALHHMIFHKTIFHANIRKTASRGSNKFQHNLQFIKWTGIEFKPRGTDSSLSMRSGSIFFFNKCLHHFRIWSLNSSNLTVWRPTCLWRLTPTHSKCAQLTAYCQKLLFLSL